MKKSKINDIDLLYTPEEDSKKKNKKRKKKSGKNETTIKKDKKDVFDFDNEIVIGITKKEEKPEKKSKKRKNKKTQKKEKDSKTKQTKKITKEKKRNTKTFKLIKYLVLLAIVLGATIYFMLSPVFNIKTITVTGNDKLTTDEIISLSGISTDVNMFKIRTGQAERKVKENAYVESASISRRLPSEMAIEITERKATFMLEFVNSFVYINNQGYMLEITDQKIAVPIITGINTPMEEFKVGNRLNVEDLQRMETVLKIMETLGSYELSGLVTKINIADKKNYTLILEGEGKTVYLGNASNINTRIMYLKEILAREKGINSEIFINGDINKDEVYTREKV